MDYNISPQSGKDRVEGKRLFGFLKLPRIRTKGLMRRRNGKHQRNSSIVPGLPNPEKFMTGSLAAELSNLITSTDKHHRNSSEFHIKHVRGSIRRKPVSRASNLGRQGADCEKNELSRQSRNLDEKPVERKVCKEETRDRPTESSIMNRPRPVEGNNLFGGRQRVYRIAESPSRSPREEIIPRPMRGRILYTDDIRGLSAKNKFFSEGNLRRVRNDLTPGENQQSSQGNGGDYVSMRHQGRLLNETGRWKTNNNIASKSSISVTAAARPILRKATSTEQGFEVRTAEGLILNRSVSSSARLYEQSLKDQLDSQLRSVRSRLQKIQCDLVEGNEADSDSGISLGTPWDRSPTTSSPSNDADGDTPQNEKRLCLESWKDSMGSQTVSSEHNDQVDLPVQVLLPIQPKDRGKATAIGAFQRPRTPYSEERFSQRQRQLYRQVAGRSPLRSETMAQHGVTQSRSFSSRRLSRGEEKEINLIDARKQLLSEKAIFGCDVRHRSSKTCRPVTPRQSPLRNPRPVRFHHQPKGSITSIFEADFESPRASPPLRSATRDAILLPIRTPPPRNPRRSRITAGTGALSPMDSPRLPSSLKKPKRPSNSTNVGIDGLGAYVRHHLRNDSDTSSCYHQSPSPAPSQKSQRPQRSDDYFNHKYTQKRRSFINFANDLADSNNPWLLEA